MNITVVVMILASLGFVLIGAGIVNSKYIKNNKSDDEVILNEIKAMKISGYINMAIGVLGVLISTISLFKVQWIKVLLIIFVSCILVLSLIQYLLTKKIRK